MELSKQSYIDIVQMPVDALKRYVSWKIKYDESISKMKSESLGNMKV
jgi:hypothetical protein